MAKGSGGGRRSMPVLWHGQCYLLPRCGVGRCVTVVVFLSVTILLWEGRLIWIPPARQNAGSVRILPLVVSMPSGFQKQESVVWGFSLSVVRRYSSGALNIGEHVFDETRCSFFDFFSPRCVKVVRVQMDPALPAKCWPCAYFAPRLVSAAVLSWRREVVGGAGACLCFGTGRVALRSVFLLFRCSPIFSWCFEYRRTYFCCGDGTRYLISLPCCKQ